MHFKLKVNLLIFYFPAFIFQYFFAIQFSVKLLKAQAAGFRILPMKDDVTMTVY
jgi:hypothetical protein